MPEKKVVQEQPSLLQRWFGSEKFTPEMEKGIAIARAEDPTVGQVEPYGFLSKVFSGGNLGYTSPGKGIYLNPSLMEEQNPQQIANTVLHEQQHVKQMNERGTNPISEFLHEVFSQPGLSYNQRPDEMAAYDLEKKRNARLKLPQPYSPSFLTGEMRKPTDINLSKQKRTK